MITAPGAALKAAAGHACTGGLQAAAIASAVVLGALAVLIFTGLRVAADPAHAGDAQLPTSAQPRTSESA
jgi:hypothetical protein